MYGPADVFTDSALGYYSAVFSPDGMYIVAGDYGGIVKIWPARSGRLVRRVKAHMDSVKDMVFMPDGKALMSGSWEMTLKYWDVGSLSHSPITDDK